MKHISTRAGLFLVPLLVALLAFLPACDSQFSTSFDDISNNYIRVTGRSPEFTISFEYPKSWERSSPSYKDGFFISVGKPEKSYGGVFHTPGSIEIRLQTSWHNSKEWIDLIVEAAKYNWTDLNVMANDTRTVGTLTGKWLEFSHGPNPGIGTLANSSGVWPNLHRWEYLIDWQDKLLGFRVECDEDLTEEIRADYLHLLSTFQIVSMGTASSQMAR